ncbi:amino acid adenylation domain-containing protein [Moritella sp. 36]|uniref:non-ribosomal peptide synthetase n=1 Tax=Moritella sp. 36 TaxID=2746233 RepID=UPI001BA6332B|nr:non-ribosomal peptide synthetase [Moritella sp. 36]QUM89316.1 amino acid adenylation domain-containing protein [Moritella sp. 36]
MNTVVKDLMELTYLQKEILLEHVMDPDNPKTNIGAFYRFTGINMRKIIESHRKTILDHQVFRVRFTPCDDLSLGVKQYLSNTVFSGCEIYDLRNDEDAEVKSKGIIDTLLQTSFTLYDSPLYRFALIRLPDDKTIYMSVTHHAIADDYGVLNFLNELYNDYVGIDASIGHNSDWYICVASSTDYFKSAFFENDKGYWRSLLEGKYTPLLKSKYPLGEIKKRSGKVSFFLERKLLEKWASSLDAQGILLPNAFLALWRLYLHQVHNCDSGDGIVNIGIPVHGRRGAEKDMVNLMANILVHPVNCSNEYSFIELCHQIQSQIKTANKHRKYPLGQLRRDLDLESTELLYEFGFNYLQQVENSDKYKKVDKISLQFMSNYHNSTPLALTVVDFACNDKAECQFDYNLTYFDSDDIALLWPRFEKLLKQVINDPHKKIQDIQVITEEERHTLLHTWNQTDAPYPQDKTIHQLFEAQVERTPDNIALVFEGEALTYRELNNKANQLARVIVAEYAGVTGGAQATQVHSLPADTLVALYFDRSLEMVMSILAVLKAGGAYVPVSPEYPAERIRFILDDTKTSLLLTQQHHMSSLDALLTEADEISSVFRLAVDDEKHAEGVSINNLIAENNPTSLAYVIYTSGTTGKPKGVMIENGVFAHFIDCLSCELFNEPMSVLSLTGYTFDIFGLEYAAPLITGGVVVLSMMDRVDEDLIRYGNRINCIQQTPSMWLTLLEKDIISSGLEHVHVLSGGESGSRHLYDSLLPYFASVKQVYGPTETCIWSTISTYWVGGNRSIGMPLSNELCYVLGDNRELLPIGSPGELYIGGAGLARGYLNRPDLTAASFIDNPFATEADVEKGYTRLYKTGDLVRWLPDGNLEYLGRNDNQVKIRGYRIELGEIETVLAAQDTVKQAVVIDRERNGSKYLAAYLVADLHSEDPCENSIEADNVEIVRELDIDTIRHALLAELPEYMVPASFTVIEQVPLTINGKLDRRALPEPEFTESDTYVAPRTALEAQLCQVWQDVLAIEQVGIQDNFFRIGGDSITAIRLTAVTRKEMHLDIPLSLLFEHKTIASLAQCLASLDSAEMVIIPKCELDEPALSFAQARLLFIETFEQGSSVYHIPALLQLDNTVDIDVLAQAIRCVVERHPVLNSSYRSHNDGQYYQQLLGHPPVIHKHTVADKNTLVALVHDITTQPFDLANEAPMRVHHYSLPSESYLLILWHHIAFDGWSTEIFEQELSHCYSALLNSKPITLPELSIDYGDYAVWQRGYLQGEVLERLLDYWGTQLSGFETLNLPTDKVRPAQIDYTGRDLDFTLDEGLSQQLRSLAKQQGTTLYTVMLSAFYVTLSTLSGQDDIVLGSPSDNRHHAQTQALIGFFVNVLALRSQVNKQQTIEAYLSQVHEVVTGAKVHQELPFERIVDYLKLERDTSRHPLFQVMFSVQNFAGQDFVEQNAEGNELQLKPVVLGASDAQVYAPAKYDISFVVNDGQGRLSINLNYAISLFDAESMQRLVGMYQRVIKAMVVNPQQQIADIDMLSAEERHTLLHTWNQTDSPYPQDKTIHQLFEAQVERTPDNIALVFEGEALTYRELNNKANQLARVIVAEYAGVTGGAQATQVHSLPADTLVALYLDRSLEMVISILAVLKAGGAYVPISPEYPAERIQFTLEDTKTSLLLTQQHHMPSLDALLTEADEISSVFRLAVDDEKHAEGVSTNNLIAENNPTSLAYVIYTSGTTGKPKGVMIEHKGLVNLSTYMLRSHQLDINVNAMLFSNYVFDALVYELFPGVISGCVLYMISEKEKSGVDSILDFIERKKITKAFIPTALINSFSDSFVTSSLSILHTGGDRLNNLSVKPSKLFFNEYGPTESTVCVTQNRTASDASVGIGKAIDNINLYVIGNGGQLQPIGSLGELYIGGAGLARGYLNRPDLTAASFIDNPFATEADVEKGYTRLYKTGDLVRWLPDGNLEYLGRNDNQVKIRGYRIELGEIETVLAAQDTVKQAVVIDRERNGSKYLAAYLVADLHSEDPCENSIEADNVEIVRELDIDTIRHALLAELPEYMVPASFTVIEQVPLTINGKLDRRALPEPEFTESDTYVAPRTALEAQLCQVWQDVLAIEQVGIQDDFFRIGGDSITAIRLTAVTRKEMHLDTPLSLLFEHKTIASLAQCLASLDSAEMVIIPKCDLDEPALSFAQERLLFIETFEQGSSAYHIPALLQLDNTVDIDVLAQAIRCVVERHPILNSSYRSHNDGQYYQQLLGQPPVIHKHTVADKNTLVALVHDMTAQPFDLANEAPMRVHHYSLLSESYLLILWHHIAFDGWSTEIFERELSHCYAALLDSKPITLPELSITYGDYAVWQRGYLQGEVRERLLDYWGTQLSGFETLNLPTDKVRPAQIDYTGRDLDFTLDEGLSQQLRSLAKQQGTTLYTVMLSAFYVTLSTLSGQDDIVLGSPSDNRHHAQTQALIGFFVNVLALRSQVNKQQTIEAYLSQVHEVVTGAKVHQELPFERIVDYLKLERDTSRHPLFQVMFSVQNFAGQDFVEQNAEGNELQLKPVVLGASDAQVYAPAKYDISFVVNDGQGRLSINLNYAISLFDAESMQRLVGMYQRVIKAMVVNPQQQIADIDMLSAEERHTLLHTWNQTDAPYPQDKTIHQLFEAQVERTPDNIALVFEGEALTYRELNNKANQLARVIVAQHARMTGQAQATQAHSLPADTLVALYLDRSLEMVMSILAVLKAGGAYVPVSPEYPAERIQFILEDTKTSLLLTQQHHMSSLDVLFTEADEISSVFRLAVDDEKHAEGVSTNNLIAENNPTSLAYVIYTSGTTGKPKGVMIEHHSVCHLVAAQAERFNVNNMKNALLFSAYVFDASVFELFVSLSTGHTLYLCNEVVRKDYLQLSFFIEDNAIELATLPPVMLSMMSPERLMSIKSLIVAGESPQREMMETFGRQTNIFNAYGPTESTVCASVHCYDKGLVNNIGVAINNVQLFVLDRYCNLLPIGTSGELYIGGAGLARGYLNRPDLTAASFIDNPFATEADVEKGYTRLYKTGDLVRWLPDGNLEYLGRNDNQVKIRGYRIELGEIETVLAAQDNVKQAVVIDRERNGRKYLAAYLVADLHPEDPCENSIEADHVEVVRELDIDTIRHALLSALPEYMVPASFTVIEQVPLTINGKLDRRALPEPNFTESDTYVAPRTALEIQLCQVWQDVLGIEQVGIQDNFFRIGGDSIISIQLVSRLRRASFDVQVKDVFDAPSVSQLASLLLSSRDVVEIDAEQGVLTGELRLLPIQSWFFDQQYAVPNHWNQSFTVRIPHDISRADIKRVLEVMTEHHDILRAGFKFNNENGINLANTSKVSQHYLSPQDAVMAPLHHCDVSRYSGNEDAELIAQMTQWQANFNIENGPLWRAVHLTGCEDGQARVWFAFHHLIIDAVSWRILADDMMSLLKQSLAVRLKGDVDASTSIPSLLSLGKKTSSYRQWTDAVNAYPAGNPDEQAYWHSVLSDLGEPPVLSEVQHQVVSLSELDTKRLLHKANLGYSSEINDVLLSALTLALQHTFEHTTHHIALEGHGREQLNASIDVSRTVGWFTTQYPVRLEGQKTLRDTLISTKEMLRAIPNKGIGFGPCASMGDNGQRLAMPAISFNYLGQFDNATGDSHADGMWQLTGEPAGLDVSAGNQSDLALNINGFVQDGQLMMMVSSQLSDEQTRVFNWEFERALQDVIAHCCEVADAGGITTACDYPYAGITQAQLEPLQSNYDIEDLYPANSLQQGFIYHHLHQPNDDAYRVQLLLDVHAELDIVSYQQAWALASLRYPILRTAFNWDNNMLQVITKGASISADNFTVIDLSHLDTVARDAEIERIQVQDRKVGFDLTKPGLLRFVIMKHHNSHYSILMSEHHSISDGWSGPVLQQTVLTYYKALMAGQTPAVEQDNAYPAAQAYLVKNKKNAQAYWDKKAAEFAESNDINTLLSNPIDLSVTQVIITPAEQALVIKGDDYHALKQCCRQLGITINVMAQFAWHKLLHTYTHDEQTIVGTTVSGRDIPIDGIESSVGLYINTLPLAIDWREDATVRDMLTHIQEEISSINSHSGVALASLQKQGERLFHSLFVFENYPTPEGDSDEDTLNICLCKAVEKVDYPLSVMAYEHDGSLVIKLSYDESWLSAEQANRLLGQMSNVVNKSVITPDMPHNAISLISDNERHTLLHTWNQTDAPYPQDKTIHQLFEAQVERTPDNIALVFEGEALTYRELNNKANQLARVIVAEYAGVTGGAQATQVHSLPADTLVALYFDRSLEMVMSILAVLKAGGAYVPVSPEYPAERIQFILEDTKTSLLLTQQHHMSSLDVLFTEADEISSVFRLAVDDEKHAEGVSTNNLIAENNPTSLAYVIYTSGTTGKPKGVMIEHHSVCHLVAAQAERFNVNNMKNALLFSAYVFDASVFELFVSLSTGHTLYLCNEVVRKDYLQLSFFIEDNAIELATLPPVMLSMMSPERLMSIKSLIVAGESPQREMMETFGRQTNIFNAYGPTESTVCASVHCYDKGLVNNIGVAINNVQLFVLDRYCNLLPIGTSGELYIGGAGLARGYLNRPDLTAASFIDNPFATEADVEKGYTRLYKTGDLVRWLPNGNLEYLGRNDNQVKIRGYRIELGEVETVLAAQDNVKQAVVIDRERHGSKYLAAYLVADLHSEDPCENSIEADYVEIVRELDIDTIRHALLSALPEYMVPASFTVIEQVPLTINGKLDRRALPEPNFTESDTYVAPRTALEIQLCQVWQDVLAIEQVGIQDDFFRIGGNSILAIQLVSVIRRQLDIEIPLAIIFSHTCIFSLSDWLGINCFQNELLSLLTPTSTATQALFMIHATGCGSEVYASLAEALSTEYNCIGINNYNFLNSEKVDSLHKLASIYLELILNVTSIEQPIRLLGWSSGGLLSMEIAYQLEQLGARDIKIYLLDSVIATKRIIELSAQQGSSVMLETFEKQLRKEGVSHSYIDNVLAALPFELKIGNCTPSGKLLYSNVVLFKAGKRINDFGSATQEFNQLIVEMHDNNITKWVSNTIENIVIEECDHQDILTAKDILCRGIKDNKPKDQQRKPITSKVD